MKLCILGGGLTGLSLAKSLIKKGLSVDIFLTKKSLDKTISEMAGKEYSFLKKKLTEVLISELTPVGKEVKKLLEDKSHLKNILKKGSEKANIIAEENLKNIREKVGLI